MYPILKLGVTIIATNAGAKCPDGFDGSCRSDYSGSNKLGGSFSLDSLNRRLLPLTSWTHFFDGTILLHEDYMGLHGERYRSGRKRDRSGFNSKEGEACREDSFQNFRDRGIKVAG